MSAHLTEPNLERFRTRTLPPEELLAADEHLSACEGCRRRLASNVDFRGMVSALREELTRAAVVEEHLAYEQFESYVEGALRGAELDAAARHISACDACADEARELFELRESMNAAPLKQTDAAETVASETASPSPRRGLRETLATFRERYSMWSPRWAAAAFAVLLLASLSAWWLVSTSRRESEVELAQQPQPTTQTQPTPQPQSTTQTQTNSQAPSPSVQTPAPTPDSSDAAAPVPTAEHVGSQAQPSHAATPNRYAPPNRNHDSSRGDASVELASVPPSYRETVRRALRAGALTESSTLDEVRSAPRTLLGGAGRGEDSFALETPAGVVSRSDRPAFRWRPLRDAEGYTVKVYDSDFNLVTSSPRLSTPEWTPAEPLARGRVYAWQVTAKRGVEEVVAPAPPAPEARFKVLSRAQDEALTLAEREARGSHLTLGVLYARAGLLEDAEREFNAHLRANPRSAAARKLLRSLLKMRQHPRRG